MTTRTVPSSTFGNIADLWHSLGDVPLERIVLNPCPGTATEEDLLRFVDRDKRLVELIDGTLVEKTVGWLESQIALNIAIAIKNFITGRKLGIVAGAQATLRMRGGNIRLPDATFISVNDLPGGQVPSESVPMLPPTLAVEVISEGNTNAEMQQKLKEYFHSGAKLVWFIYPKSKTVVVFAEHAGPPKVTLTEVDTLDGGSVLPGFIIPVADIFNTAI